MHSDFKKLEGTLHVLLDWKTGLLQNLAFNILIRAISELLLTIFFAVLMDEE